MHLDAVVDAERPRLVERRVDPGGDLRGSSPSRAYLRGTRRRDRLDRRVALLRERDRRRDHLLADVAELHRDEDPLELGAGRKHLDRRDVFEQTPRRAAADDDEHDEASAQPDRAGVARAGMGEHGEHPDREGERRADERRDREPSPRTVTFGRRAVRPREVGLANPQPDDGELGGGERDEDAERVQAREECGVAVAANSVSDDEPDREAARDRDRLLETQPPVESREPRGSEPCSASDTRAA